MGTGQAPEPPRSPAPCSSTSLSTERLFTGSELKKKKKKCSTSFTGLARWHRVGGSLQTPALITSRISVAVVHNSLFLMKLELEPVKSYKNKGEGGKKTGLAL